MKTKIREIKVRSVLIKSRLPATDFVINPYVGCQHSCKYCYADFMRRFTGHSSEQWGGFVDVKINASETIDFARIPKNSKILIGSVTDPYQPVEASYQITRKCLEKLLTFQPKLEILTKSSLILRDMDLLKKFKNLRVGISIGIYDDAFSREMEPLTTPPSGRVELLRKLHEGGIRTYVFVSPIFPEISNIPKLLDSVEGIVEEALFENLNIRSCNKSKIMMLVREHRPELESLYGRLQGDKEYWEDIKNEIVRECKSRKIKYSLFFFHGRKD